MTYQLKNIKNILIHEFGHLFGYCLANKSDKTFFCEPKQIDFGYKNFITPSEKIFHITDIMQDRKNVHENTKDISKTIAWFIEVISGCDFETKFKVSSFQNCFCYRDTCSGSKDFANLSVIRNISSFAWSFDDIYNLQMDYRLILETYNIYQSIENVVEKFLAQHGEKDFYILEDVELNYYKDIMNKLIGEELHLEYLNLISKYEKNFK